MTVTRWVTHGEAVSSPSNGTCRSFSTAGKTCNVRLNEEHWHVIDLIVVNDMVKKFHKILLINFFAAFGLWTIMHVESE